MNEILSLSNDIFERYGAIKRARGCFLYTEKSIRLTDMYREGGRAILGWGGSSAFTMLKNALNRGSTGSFCTREVYQLDKAASALIDNRLSGKPSRKVFVCHCASDVPFAKGAKTYTPFSPERIDYSTEDVVIIEPPLALSAFSSVTLIAVKAEKSDCIGEDFASVFLSAPMAAGVARSLFDLIKEEREWQEKDFFIYDSVLTKYWTRKGCYLFPKVKREDYREFVRHCLDCEIVISPLYDVPSIVPFGADKGVFSKLKNTPFVSGASN